MREVNDGQGREALTARRREITSLIARGYTNRQIATELVISPGTVGNHVEQILRRLALGSRVELATWASEHGLTTSQDRLVTTLERLLEIDPRDLDVPLDAATGAVADVLAVEKVDAFLYHPATATLVARGTSPQRARAQAACARTPSLRAPDCGGRAARRVVRGFDRRRFLHRAGRRVSGNGGRWVGVVVHRAELTRLAESEAAARSRRTAAEQLVTVMAHDFRNLLTPLRGRLELLGRGPAATVMTGT